MLRAEGADGDSTDLAAVVWAPGTYGVCWCPADCATSTARWHRLATIAVRGPAYTWSVVEGSLRIERPFFSGVSDSAGWRLRQLDARHWSCALAAEESTPTTTDGREAAVFALSADAIFRACLFGAEDAPVLVEGPSRDMVVRGTLPRAEAPGLRWTVNPGRPFQLLLRGGVAAVGDTVSLCGDHADSFVPRAQRSSRGPVLIGEAWPLGHGHRRAVHGGAASTGSTEARVCVGAPGEEVEVGRVRTALDIAAQQVFVLEPDVQASIEVLGRELSPKDRLLLVRVGDVCGVPGLGVPTELQVATGAVLNGGLYSWAAVSPSTAVVSDRQFARVLATYVELRNLPAPLGYSCQRCANQTEVRNYTVLVDWPDRLREELAENECNGFLAGDEEDDSVVCATEETCKELCAAAPACGSIDMHRTLERCFLNHGAPNLRLDTRKDTSFDLLVKEDRGAEAPGSELIASTTEKLVFSPVTVPAGEYTVCFCDSGASGGTRPCGRAEDYGLEIGRVIASGVSCLLDLPQHRCVEQKMGGLRCEYGGERCSDELPVFVGDSTVP